MQLFKRHRLGRKWSLCGPRVPPSPAHGSVLRFGGNVGEEGCELAKVNRDTLWGGRINSLTWDEVISDVCMFVRIPQM